ncbi:MAG: D-alanyl-D-alanine carboxypeptidase family protein [Faecousia sp.]
MKRFFAGTAAALLAAVLILPGEAYAVSAEKAYSLDAVSGRVLFDKNADSRSLIASTTKIMTALVICEQCNVLDRMRIPREAVGIEGSSMYLQEGEVLTIQELLYGLMLSSGNDAAVALAIYCGGTVEGFVELMNDKARLLGLRNTHFENPNGLDSPGHYSSARDLAVLAAYAMENPIFAKTVSAKTVTAGQRYLRNHNKLLWMVDGADGVKTGFTKAAGRALVSSATRDGRRIIAVTLNDPNDWQEHKALLEEGFSRFHVQRIVTAGDLVGTVEVAGGEGARVEILAAEHFVYALAPEENPQVVLPGPGFVYAPVAEGAGAGFAYVLIQGKAVGKFPVVYGQTVEQEREEPKSFWEKLFGRKAHEGTIAENTVRQGGGLPAEQ